MSYDLVKKSAGLMGGAALAGLGFSFGKDMYNKKKGSEVVGEVLFYLMLFAFLSYPYLSGLWSVRACKTGVRTVFVRFWGWFMTVALWGVLSVPLLILVPSAIKAGTDDSITFLMILGSSSLIYLILFLVGMWKGVKQNKKRREVWAVEEANVNFMLKHNLIQESEDVIYDEKADQYYEIECISTTEIALSPSGHRGGMAYIIVHPSGRYVKFTGLRQSFDPEYEELLEMEREHRRETKALWKE